MTIELSNITFKVPVYYTDQELDLIEEELKETEDVTSVACDSTRAPVFHHTMGERVDEVQETIIVFSVKTDNYKHIIGRLELAIKECLKRITAEHER